MGEDATRHLIGINRRDFLKVAGGVVASVVAGVGGEACSTGEGAPASTSTTTSSTPASTTTSRATTTTGAGGPPTSADWALLSHALEGDLVLPGSSKYATAAESYNPVFDAARPQAVAYVASSADAAAAVAFGREHDVPLSIRSGGHSYGGWSTGSGLVIDVSRLDVVTVDTSAGTAAVGTGAHQNYADPELRDWAEAYYGANLGRLEQVKAAYDPDDVFRFPQSVPLA
jgi:hypothetical protein